MIDLYEAALQAQILNKGLPIRSRIQTERSYSTRDIGFYQTAQYGFGAKFDCQANVLSAKKAHRINPPNRMSDLPFQQVSCRFFIWVRLSGHIGNDRPAKAGEMNGLKRFGKLFRDSGH